MISTVLSYIGLFCGIVLLEWIIISLYYYWLAKNEQRKWEAITSYYIEMVELNRKFLKRKAVDGREEGE